MLFSRLGSTRLRSLSLSGCARRQMTHRDVALAACVESAYARPRYAICANVLIATLSGEHKHQKQSHLVPSRRRESRSRRAVRVPRSTHTRACRTRAGAHTALSVRCTVRVAHGGFSRRTEKTATQRRLPRVTPWSIRTRSSPWLSLILVFVSGLSYLSIPQTSQNSIFLYSTSCKWITRVCQEIKLRFDSETMLWYY